MIVKVEGEKGSYVESEYEVGIEIGGQKRRVESVQTLYNDDGAVGEAELVSGPLALTLLKVEGGQLDLLAVKELAQMYAEELGVDRIYVLEVLPLAPLRLFCTLSCRVGC